MSKNNEADELSVKDAAEQAVSQVAEAGKGVVEAARATGEKYILDKWTYHVPFHTIPSEDIKETFTTDVVIAGAGTSGKAAALAARQAGAQVIQIDRHTTFRYGGGHQMAMRIGAVMEPGPHAPMAHASWAGPLGVDPFLRVNLEGVRYENEDVPAQSVANSLTRQPGMKAWQVFDSKWEEEVPLMGVGLGRYYEVSDKLRENVERKPL